MSLAALPRRAHIGLAVVVAVGFFAFMAAGITQVGWGESSDADADNFADLVAAIFDKHVLAFEVLGILLTAAMIGAMVVARPLGTVEDRTNYPNRQPGSAMPAIQDVSDVDRNLAGGSFEATALELGGEEE